MTFAHRALAVGALVAVALTGCATAQPAGPASDPPPAPASPAASGSVIGQGLVLQRDGEEPVFCLGPVLESYPPQCSGPAIVGWDWTGIELVESANDVTWGSFAVVGAWDGERFTVTEDPVPLALYDPERSDPDPRTEPDRAGAATAAELRAMQEDLHAFADLDVLTTYPENGYLWVTVVYDDGRIQDWLDAVYGDDRVAVISALRHVGG